VTRTVESSETRLYLDIWRQVRRTIESSWIWISGDKCDKNSRVVGDQVIFRWRQVRQEQSSSWRPGHIWISGDKSVRRVIESSLWVWVSGDKCDKNSRVVGDQVIFRYLATSVRRQSSRWCGCRYLAANEKRIIELWSWVWLSDDKCVKNNLVVGDQVIFGYLVASEKRIIELWSWVWVSGGKCEN